MVLGGSDMIPGVDQRLLNKCVGKRIPNPLGHGPTSRRSFGIPDDYIGWKYFVELVRMVANRHNAQSNAKCCRLRMGTLETPQTSKLSHQGAILLVPSYPCHRIGVYHRSLRRRQGCPVS
jgi:hypothetical protein